MAGGQDLRDASRLCLYAWRPHPCSSHLSLFPLQFSQTISQSSIKVSCRQLRLACASLGTTPPSLPSCISIYSSSSASFPTCMCGSHRPYPSAQARGTSSRTRCTAPLTPTCNRSGILGRPVCVHCSRPAQHQGHGERGRLASHGDWRMAGYAAAQRSTRTVLSALLPRVHRRVLALAPLL